MKTLKDHTILYDEACPMCSLYTRTFVQSGMLDQNGRLPYQQLTATQRSQIDCKRAVNEIALVNTKTGQVEYGVKSLFLILQNSFPMLRTIFQSRAFFWLADRAYKFISFNRRVIVPSAVQKHSFLDEPALHRGYRVAYLIFTWFLTAYILYNYTAHLVPIIPASNFYREFAICGGQILWQAVFVKLAAPGKIWDYLGNMMTISFAGAVLLNLLMIISFCFGIGQAQFFLTGFGIVVFLMLLEHIRRTKVLRIHPLLTLTWIVYRLILLLVIL